jgi:3-dehydroquinate dehydratase
MFENNFFDYGGIEYPSVELPKPIIEVHISVPEKRESFRSARVTLHAATSLVVGFGPSTYQIAVIGMTELLKNQFK